MNALEVSRGRFQKYLRGLQESGTVALCFSQYVTLNWN
jgi:hypothetical protein